MMNNTELSKKHNTLFDKTVWLFVLYTTFTMAVYILPYTKFVLPYIGVALLMLLSLPFMMIKNKRWFKYGVALIVVTAFLMFIDLINGFSYVDAINEVVRNLRYFLPVLWGCYALEYCTPKQQRAILFLFGIVVALILFKTLAALEEEPMIARILAQDQSHSTTAVNAYRLANVGGYPFSYMMGLVTICMADSAFVLKKKWQKIIAVAGVVLCFYFVIKSMYTILLLLTSILLMILLLIRVKRFTTKIFVVFIFFVLFFTIAPLFQFLSQVFSGTLLSSKFAQMYEALTGGGTESLGLRPKLMEQALENWLQTPVLGGKYKTSSHSMFVGVLQQNGLVGLAFVISLLGMSYRLLTKKLKEHGIDTILFKICWVYLCVLSFLNDTRYTFEITLVIFFMVPLYSDIINTHKKKIRIKRNIPQKVTVVGKG